jgi:hypothetical protein
MRPTGGQRQPHPRAGDPILDDPIDSRAPTHRIAPSSHSRTRDAPPQPVRQEQGLPVSSSPPHWSSFGFSNFCSMPASTLGLGVIPEKNSSATDELGWEGLQDD